MKLVARAVTALALLSLATPALPCGDTEHAKTTRTEKRSATVAKSGGTAKKSTAPAKKVAEAKPASAAN